jgi:cytochrome c2
VRGAQGKVGPSLSGFAGRAYVDGRLTNSPDNLIAWIVDPHAIDPPNAMPATGVGQAEARNMAAYLYTLD